MDSRAWRRFRSNPAAGVAGAVVLGLIGLALAAPLLTSRDPVAPNIDTGLSYAGAPLPPSHRFWAGTDNLGRDVLARMLYGARVSLGVGIVATALVTVIGLVIGILAGYFGGWVDTLLMRLTDLMLAFPFVLLAIALATVLRTRFPDRPLGAVVLTICLVGWTGAARVIRSKVLSVRQRDFITAARASGAGAVRIMLRHVLPNVLGPLLALATLQVASTIILESVLSYLGLGLPPEQPSWGRMIYDGQLFVRSAPWLIAWPSLMILMTVLAFNLLGEGLRDALDPQD